MNNKSSLLKKILKGFSIFFVISIIALIAFPFLFKDKIAQAVKTQINNQVNAQVNYEDAGISLFRSFPKLSLSLNELDIVGINDFKGDTLAHIQKVNIAFDLISVIKSGQKMKVYSINVIEPKINAIVLPNGKANWDIMKPSTEQNEASQPLDLALYKFKMEEAKIAYSDLQSDMFVIMDGLNFEGTGDLSQDIFNFDTHTDIKSLSYKSQNISYLNKAKINSDAIIRIDNIQNKYSFSQNKLAINDLELNYDGFVKLLENSVDMDLKFNTTNTSFKSILSLIPNIYAKDFEKVKTAGNFELNGEVKGLYTETSYPAFKLHFKINNAMFKYPDLPSTVSSINALVDITNRGGSLDNTIVHIPKLQLAIDKEPIVAVLHITTPMSDPNIDAKVKGQLNLSKVPQFYPIEGLKILEGNVVADITAKARMSQIQKEQYQNVFFAGKAQVSNFKYEASSLDWPVKAQNISLLFNPKTVKLTDFTGNIGTSDFKAKGSLSNFLPYIFADDIIKGNLDFVSSHINLNEFMAIGSSTNTSNSTASSEPILLPANINFACNAKINKMEYDQIQMTNVSGIVILMDRSLNLSNLYTEVLGGTVTLNGMYDTKDKLNPKVNFNYEVNKIDFQKSFKAIPSMEKLAPVAKYLNGIFSTNMNLNTNLNNDMSPDYNSMTGKAIVKIDLAKVVNMPVLKKIFEVTKLKQLDPMEIKDAWTELKFNNGRVYIEKPYTIKVQDYAITFSGSQGFDKTNDYKVSIEVPTSKLGNARGVADKLLSQVPIPGLNGMMPDILVFNLHVVGTIDKPVITLGNMTTSTGGKTIQDQAKETLLNAAQKEADKLKNQAKIEAQKQIDIAKQQAQEQLNKAQQEAQKKVQEELRKAQERIKNKVKLPW
jgi:hypothetical protein